MENSIVLKKILRIFVVISIVFIFILLFINNYYYKKYTVNYNNKISSIIYKIKKDYPSITSEEIANILNNENDSDLSMYGIDIENESIIEENDKLEKERLIVEILIIITFVLIIVYILYIFNKKKNKNIYDIAKMIEDIEEGIYLTDFENKSEDELSVLKDNLSKIAIKLKEQANNSLKDKISLKEDIENISHQLKTPLTSITILLDNLLESESISDKKRKDFLIDIKKEVNNINFLVKNLLNLSRFDANAIEFNKKSNYVMDIINKSIDKVDLIRELKNVKIDVKGKNYRLICDFNWEVEAISNIIKNAIEHSNNNALINIEIGENKIYKYIKIINDGKRINDKDLDRIFKRFYSGKNSLKESTGIGLSLAKAIVEKDGGKIIVYSKKNTTFEINYYRLK